MTALLIIGMIGFSVAYIAMNMTFPCVWKKIKGTLMEYDNRFGLIMAYIILTIGYWGYLIASLSHIFNM